MENAYGIGVKNRYELFYDEDVDPLEIIRQQEVEKEKRKSDKTHPKDKNKNIKPGKTVPAAGITKKARETTATNPTKLAENTDVTNKPRSRPFTDRTSKNTRSFDDAKEMEERKNFRNREDHGQSFDNRDSFRDRDPEQRRGRGGFRGGRGRGARGGRGGFFNHENRPPRRDFDRHSGSDKTGMRPVDKRDGAGSNNWGDMKSEFNPRKKDTESSTWMDDEPSGEKQSDSTWGEVIPETNASVVSKEEGTGDKTADDSLENDTKENLPISDDRDESAKEMTFDEWKREQEAKRAVPKYNLRKPGEGEDGNQWKKLYVLKKKVNEEEDDEDDDEEDDEDNDEDELARRGRQRQLVDIQINFNDSRRGRGRGRGGRGGMGIRSDRGPNIGGPNKDFNREERERRDPVSGPNVGGGGAAAAAPTAAAAGGGRSYRGSMKITKSGQQSAPRVDDWNDFPSLVTA